MPTSMVHNGSAWSIQRFISGFANNAFLITCATTNKSIIIDTPANPTDLIAAAKQTDVSAILITHGHQDHVEGFAEVNELFSVSTGIGIPDRASLPSTPSSSIDVTTGTLIKVGEITLEARFTPGHTPGSTCYVLRSKSDDDKSFVFTGDTLFPGGPGRSSSNEALKHIVSSLKDQIYTLPGEHVILPGHGEFTDIGSSRKEFEQFISTPWDASLAGDVTWI
ncbi:MAG: MBL fold metallo-hydrolase [Dehalococcoidia bacterium]